MAFDAFVKIDGIEGECSGQDHQGWIEVLYYKTKLNQNVSSTASSAGGASAERADFSDFVITKNLDKASPKIALTCAEGTHIDTILIELCRAGTDKVRVMEYKLTNCLISKVRSGGGEKIFPMETIEINFGKIEWCYIQQKRRGGGTAGNIASGWSVERNSRA
jgi:type VI secretion system secreted protein Hcp